MKKFGLIGFPLKHSFSKKYFSEKFANEGLNDCHYENFELPTLHKFKEFITENPQLRGLNVTIPHKQNILSFLDELDETAQAVGAVNTIQIQPNKLIGYNTDVFGFENSIKPLLKSHHQNALILGTGGAAKAIIYVLKKLGLEYILVSRTPDKNQFLYNDLTEEIIHHHRVIINCTPTGTFPNINELPNIPYQYIGKQHLLYDLVYNPEQTEFLKRGIEKGANVKNGLEMLYLQAEEAWRIWNT